MSIFAQILKVLKGFFNREEVVVDNTTTSKPVKEPVIKEEKSFTPMSGISFNQKQSLVLSDIKTYWMPKVQYYQTVHDKKQIYIHHTASNANPYADIDWWNSNATHVATFCVIGGKANSSKKWKDGEMVQCFSSKYWAHHLGVSGSKNKIPTKYRNREVNNKLNKESIAIEVCNWGGLTLGSDGKFKNWAGRVVPEYDVVSYDKPFRGYKYYEAYTEDQIEKLRQVLVYLCDKYDIPKDYNEDMWGISENALSGKPGIWNHTSVRSDKSDMHPDPNLIQMLKSL